MSRAVYLAGPEVFLPVATAVDIGEAKKRICAAHGLLGRFPLDGAPPPSGSPSEQAAAIFRHCVEMMTDSDAVIANLTPFRGRSGDVGTALEVGFMLARRRPVFAYTNVVEDYRDRVPPDGMTVEDFGLFDNLMCDGAVVESGAAVVRTAVPQANRFTDLSGFETCVRQAATRLS